MASNQPAGIYYIVVDGWSGAVAKYSLRADFLAGTRAAAPDGREAKQAKP